jgi:seryl-tRNA synthetase
MKKIRALFVMTLCVCVGYLVGYGTSHFGPPLDVLAARYGIELPPRTVNAETMAHAPAPEAERTIDDTVTNVYDAKARLGEYAREINTRIEALERRRKEKTTAIGLYLGRGEAQDSAVVSRLREEVRSIDRGLEELRDGLAEAVDVQERLQLVIDAAAEVDAASVGDERSLVDARAILTRIEAWGLR